MKNNYKDPNWIGQKFGRLTVVEYRVCEVGTSKVKRVEWLCRCDCGREKWIKAQSIVLGATTSCGCFRSELTSERSTTHGGRYTRLNRIWGDMKQRCTNPKNPKYPSYGGRGITVCDEWANDFTAFRDWALASGYADDLSIDRIDNDKGYCPDNCRWTTDSVQVMNRRVSKRYEFEGEMLSLPEVADRIGVKAQTLRGRMNAYGMTFEEAVAYSRQK